MKKSLAWLLTLVLLLGLLAGCGSKEKTPDNPTPPSNSDQNTPTPPPENNPPENNPPENNPPAVDTMIWKEADDKMINTYTLLAVNFLWMLFRSDTVEYAGQFFLTMLGLNGTGNTDPASGLYLAENAVFLVLALLFSFPFAPWLRERLERFRPGGQDVSLLWDLLYAVGLTAAGVLCVCYLVKGTYNPFIYFRF